MPSQMGSTHWRMVFSSKELLETRPQPPRLIIVQISNKTGTFPFCFSFTFFKGYTGFTLYLGVSLKCCFRKKFYTKKRTWFISTVFYQLRAKQLQILKQPLANTCISAPTPGKAKKPTNHSIRTMTAIVNQVFMAYSSTKWQRWGLQRLVLSTCAIDLLKLLSAIHCLSSVQPLS